MPDCGWSFIFFTPDGKRGRGEGAVWGLAFNLMPITCMSRINTHTPRRTLLQPTHTDTFAGANWPKTKKLTKKFVAS